MYIIIITSPNIQFLLSPGNDYDERKDLITFLVRYMSAFLLLDVELEVQSNAIDVKTNLFKLDGLEYEITIERKSKSAKALEVFSLFDVLVNKVTSTYYSVIGLFEHMLVEDKQEILGRACGDRVACISLRSCSSPQSLVGTVAHETLHTFGIDHNSSHRCLMNAVANEDEW